MQLQADVSGNGNLSKVAQVGIRWDLGGATKECGKDPS